LAVIFTFASIVTATPRWGPNKAVREERMSFKKAVIGIGMGLAMFTGMALAQTPDVYLTVVDTAL
jgi:hypothetical protein